MLTKKKGAYLLTPLITLLTLKGKQLGKYQLLLLTSSIKVVWSQYHQPVRKCMFFWSQPESISHLINICLGS